MTTHTEMVSDDESCHKQKIAGVSQTGVDNTLHTLNVCETTTKSNWADIVKSSNVSPSESYETQFPTLGRPLTRKANVTQNKQIA